jgi:hypothetical protein
MRTKLLDQPSHRAVIRLDHQVEIERGPRLAIERRRDGSANHVADSDFLQNARHELSQRERIRWCHALIVSRP